MSENNSAKWKRNIFGIVLLVFTLLFVSGNVNAWFDSNWEFRQIIDISSSSSSTNQNHQIQLILENSNVGTNFDWSRACEDLRFINSDDSTQLNYWIESCSTSNQNASVWIKIPEIITTSTKQIYMYYGNDASSSLSNGENTFDFFDDFETNLNKWTQHKNSADISIVSGYLELNGGTTTSPFGHTVIGSNASYNNFTNGIIEGEAYLLLDSIAEIGTRGDFSSNTGYKSRMDARSGEGVSHLKPPYTDSSWSFLTSCAVTGGGITTTTWIPFRVTVNGNSFTIQTDGESVTCNDAEYASSGEISLQNHYGNSARYDNIRVRKHFDQTISTTLNSQEELNPIYYIAPTPSDGVSLPSNSTPTISTTIEQINLTSFSFFWDTTSYSYYDNDLSLMMNLDNIGSLGESSSNVLDVSLYNNSGILYGDSSFNVFGKYGGAAYFDGTDDWIQIPDAPELDSMTEFTFQAWLYKQHNDANPRGIASKRTDSSSGRAWSIFSWNGEEIYFDVASDRHGSGVSLPGNQWVHLTVTFDGNAPSSERKKFYYDGELVATQPSSETSIPKESGSDLFIGILNQNYGDGWEGYIDEVKIWDKTLSDSEISHSFNSSLNKNAQNNWTFTITKSNLSDNEYFYNATVSDSTNSFSTPTRNLFIGSSLIFRDPTPNDNSIFTRNYIPINVTKSNLSNNLGIYLYNSTNLVGSFNSSTSPAYFNFTGLLSGNYFFNATLFAANGTILQKTSTREVTLVNDINTAINFVSPTPANDSTISGNSTQINATIEFDSFDTLKEFNFKWLDANYSIFDNSLIALFNLDENTAIGESATTAIDNSLKNNTGTISGASWTTNGVFGKALDFTGSNSLSLPSFSDLNGQSEATIMGWINQDTLSSDQYFLWADGNVLIQLGDTFNVPGVSNLRIRWNLQGDWRNSHTVENILDVNTWNHWAFTFNSGETRIYKNGDLVYNGSDTQTSISTNSPTYSFGTRTGDGLDGKIDEIKMYSRALNASEIRIQSDSNLKKINNNNWKYLINRSNLDNGTYTYSIGILNNLDILTQTPQRVFYVGDTFDITTLPENNSKFFDTQVVPLELNSSSPLVSVSYYLNNNLSTLTTMQTSDNLLWRANQSFSKIGTNNITYIYNESSSIQKTLNTSLLILKNSSSSISKSISWLNSDLYQISIEIENKINSSQSIVPIDFVESKFNFGSFTPIYNWTNLSNGTDNGTILGWNLNVGPLSSSTITYSITKKSPTYYLRDKYIIGLD